MKKTVTLLVALSMLLPVCVGCGKKETPGKGVTLLDRTGQTLCTAVTTDDLHQDDRWAFYEIAVAEAVMRLADTRDLDPAEAKRILFYDGYRVQTTFDPTAFAALQAALQKGEDGVSYGCALTDLNGNLLAAYSVGDEHVNYAGQTRPPYSAFKPLSVYTPAVEKGLIHWSTLYEDSPAGQVKNEKGEMQDWPSNSSGKYSRKEETVYDALRASLNTVAVKCLRDVGVAESVKFLQNSFNIPLWEEDLAIQQFGEEEVLGSVALGYLETGVTTVQMAGFYQIFATGGKYTAPAAVSLITDEAGNIVYARKEEPREVVSPATADLMNRMLRGVLLPGGTGTGAYCSDVEVAGKTGTGDDNEDNWFVGVTPGYSCAVWHGSNYANQAGAMFALVMGELYKDGANPSRKFITHKNLNQIAYCAVSGQAIAAGCKQVEMGYYQQADALQPCGVCVKKQTEG